MRLSPGQRLISTVDCVSNWNQNVATSSVGLLLLLARMVHIAFDSVDVCAFAKHC